MPESEPVFINGQLRPVMVPCQDGRMRLVLPFAEKWSGSPYGGVYELSGEYYRRFVASGLLVEKPAGGSFRSAPVDVSVPPVVSQEENDDDSAADATDAQEENPSEQVQPAIPPEVISDLMDMVEGMRSPPSEDDVAAMLRYVLAVRSGERAEADSEWSKGTLNRLDEIANGRYKRKTRR